MFLLVCVLFQLVTFGQYYNKLVKAWPVTLHNNYVLAFHLFYI